VSLYLRPGPGSAAELSMIGQALERLRELLPPGLLVIADSALGNIKPLSEADRAGLRFIAPLRAVTGFRERFLDEVGEDALRPLRYVSERERRLPAAKRTRYRGVLHPFEVEDPETGERRCWRVAYVHSSEEEREIRAARERALEKAEDALGRIERGLGGRHYKTKAQVDKRLARVLAPVEGLIEAESGERGGRPTLTWRRDAEAIERAARTDGITALATNIPGRLSAERVLATYKQQWMVERRHRDLKQTLRVRPIFLQNDDRIEALVSIVGLALLVFGLIEAERRGRLGDEELAGLLPEGRTGPPTARNILAAFQGLGLTYTAQGIVLDRLTPTQRRILELLEVDIPWPEQTSLAA
jgi:transposase